MTAQLLLGLSILVGLHEMGHLLAAKAFGMRVEKFSIGFPPKIFGFTYGETEYSLGALPLGGYVKISGIIDESLDTEQLAKEPEPYEFRAKPAWQRLIVMMGGIVVNLITGVIIFVILVYVNGETYTPMKGVNQYGISTNELGKQMGLLQGDKIIKINGKGVEKFEDVYNPSLLLDANSYYTVIRDGKEIQIQIPADFLDKISDKGARQDFVQPLYPFQVGEVEKGSPAEKAGLQKGDQILAVSGVQISFLQEFQQYLREHQTQTVELSILRANDSLKLPVQVRENGTIGFIPNMKINYETAEYSFVESIPKGTSNAFNVIWLNVKAFGKIFSGEMSASKSLSGPIGIAKIFGGTWDWLRFWTITGMLSMVLAFMNFLPIPALDGGHVMFLTYEIVSGKAPSDRFLENAQKVGMAILLGLMVFAFGNDIYKLFVD